MFDTAVTYDKKLWAEAVLTLVYIKNREPHSALKDLTCYEACYGSKPSIQHLQPFGRECYICLPYTKWKDGIKLSRRAQWVICNGYTNTINRYRVFWPNRKKTVVLADIIFPPLKIRGASPLIHHQVNQHLIPLQSQQTSVHYTYTNNGKSNDDLLNQWMKENPQEPNDIADNGHESINRIMLADFKPGKRDDYVGAPYCVYNDKDMAYREALSNESV